MEPLIIAVAGVTNGGKTTLCKKLKTMYPEAEVLNMDDFYWPENSSNFNMIEEFKYPNYDEPASVDIKSMEKAVLDWKDKVKSVGSASDYVPILLVEGILILNFRQLVPHFSLMFYITLEKEECFRRRQFRTYLPPLPDGYDDAITWPEYLKWKDELPKDANIVYLDGMLTPEEITKRVSTDINKHIEKMKPSQG